MLKTVILIGGPSKGITYVSMQMILLDDESFQFIRCPVFD